MDGVYSCCDRTDSEGISDIVAVGIREILQANSKSDFIPRIFTMKKEIAEYQPVKN